MAKKLGKGIIRLLENVEDQRLDSDGAVLNIDINKIKQNPDQPRKSFDEETINELAASIKEYGILQPLILKREGEEYIIVAGERRYRAAIKAGLSSVPALVKNINDQKSGEISLIENLQREDLNAIEAARAMKELMEKYDLTQDELAAKLGKARSSIANTIRLLLLDEKVQTMVMENKLSAGHAKALITVADKEQQIKFAEEAIEKQLSVRELEKGKILFSSRKGSQKNERRRKNQNKRGIEKICGRLKAHICDKGKDCGQRQQRQNKH